MRRGSTSRSLHFDDGHIQRLGKEKAVKSVFFKIISNNMAKKFFHGNIYLHSVDCIAQVYQLVGDFESMTQAQARRTDSSSPRISPIPGAASLFAFSWWLHSKLALCYIVLFFGFSQSGSYA